ncbi:uncharacterized protein MELLADRAFT_90480 [Melampsora larici-populina 98AG31]|uniref:Uncharacterized protein n=1 Tax=Melampsora larici-populina (strain 98AG31 / pathotype 3-4-7) TaxID=747676 RepID=F4RX24_MELLP|nr:uncharacterized protein MELLADRAFT_90480 [Melampsora larici-populina 98AG31]EGG02885.1 hypothetical protein MELLADRAFT_90480 [Melampsora larici-populina 98AG31]
MANKSNKKKTSPSNESTIMDSNTQSEGPPQPPPPPPPPPGHSSSKPPHEHPAASLNSTYFLIQTLPDNLRGFLDHDYENKKESYKCIDYYQILTHFDPATKSRPNHKKAKLIDEFLVKVLPLIKPYQLPVPPLPMQTERTTPRDFNPLSRRVCRQDLANVIWESDSSVVIPKAATSKGLLHLYKEHVDKDLRIPGDTKYISSPKVVKRLEVKSLLMEELRLSLQDHAPHFFIHSIPMTHTVLVNLYIKFVLEESVQPGLLSKVSSSVLNPSLFSLIVPLLLLAE